MNTSKQISIMILVMAVLVVSCGVYTVWEPLRKSRAVEWQEEVRALRGANLFVNNCRVCHGTQGQGLIGPALDRPDLRPESPQDQQTVHNYLINILTCGRVGTPMPAWSDTQGGPLNEAQLEQLATLIMTGRWDLVVELGKHADTPARPVHLTEDISATATRIPMSDTSQFAKGGFIRIGSEQMEITADPQPAALTVQRGVNQTQAAAHSAGDEVLNAPTPPNPPSINQTACGQAPLQLGPPLPPPPPGEIYIVNFQYVPKNYQAKVGDRITWTNKDTVPHTVTSDTNDTYPQKYDSGLVNQNQTYSITFNAPGTFNYYCTVHPYMKATVTVQ
jgi:amicyanin